MTENENEFWTSDLYFAAYLMTAEVPFLKHQRKERRVFFIFENSPNMSDLRAQYFNKTAKVSARQYADNLRHMKSLCHMGV